MFISEHVSQSSNLRFKALKNHIYHIKEITYTPVVVGNNRFFVFDYLQEEPPATFDETTTHPIFFVNANLTLIQRISYPEPIITKFISLNANNQGTAAQGRFIINYTQEKASKTELLMEWFRGGI